MTGVAVDENVDEDVAHLCRPMNYGAIGHLDRHGDMWAGADSATVPLAQHGRIGSIACRAHGAE
jgi:hypothetical protein